MPSGLPASGWEIITGPRVGRIILIRRDPLLGVARIIGLVGVPGQQVPQPRLVADDAERLGPADPDRVLITLLSQTLCDEVDQRFEGGNITGLRAGDQGPQPVLAAVGADIPLRRGSLGPGLVGGLVDPE